MPCSAAVGRVAVPAAIHVSVGVGLGAGVPRAPRDCWRDLVAVEIAKTCGCAGSASRSCEAGARGVAPTVPARRFAPGVPPGLCDRERSLPPPSSDAMAIDAASKTLRNKSSSSTARGSESGLRYHANNTMLFSGLNNSHVDQHDMHKTLAYTTQQALAQQDVCYPSSSVSVSRCPM